MSNGKRIPPVEIRNARVLWPNFEGRKAQFNDAGRRNFCLLIDDETARKMEADEWRVKYLKPKEEGDEPQPYLRVNVSYEYFEPVIDMIQGDRLKHLKEDTIYILDTVDIDHVNCLLQGSWYEGADGNKGYTPYLKELYAHIPVSRLAQEYAAQFKEDMEESYADHGQYCNGDCSTCPQNI